MKLVLSLAMFVALAPLGSALAEEPSSELDRLNYSFKTLGTSGLAPPERKGLTIPGATSPLFPSSAADEQAAWEGAPVWAATEPSAGEVKLYEHNGSVVEWSVLPPGAGVKVTYSRPRSGMEAVGVAPGTVLFEGSYEGQHIAGKAYAFKRGCPPAPYEVQGQDDGDRIILRGLAPIRNQRGCAVQGYSDRSPNAELVFAPSPDARQ